jgi:hypothetical protein
MIISILRQTHMFEKSWATSLCPTPELLFWHNTLIKRIQVEAEKGRTRISHMLRLIDGWESEVKGGQQWDAMGIALYSGQVTWVLRRLNDFTKHIKAPRMANIHPLVIRSWRNFTAGAWGIGSGTLVVWHQNWCPRGLWHVGMTCQPGHQDNGSGMAFLFPLQVARSFSACLIFFVLKTHTTFDHIYHPLVSIYWRTKNKHHIFQVTQFRIRPPYPSKCGSHAEGPGGGSLGSGSVGISVSAAEGASVGLRFDLGSPWFSCVNSLGVSTDPQICI